MATFFSRPEDQRRHFILIAGQKLLNDGRIFGTTIRQSNHAMHYCTMIEQLTYVVVLVTDIDQLEHSSFIAVTVL
jgi:hypothetical protein